MIKRRLQNGNSMASITFRPYRKSDYQYCVDIFDANCPEYFAPNERDDYVAFLSGAPERYEICVFDGRVIGAFGLFGDDRDVKRLNWILLDPQAQGIGAGSWNE